MSLDGALVLCPWVSCLQITQCDFQPVNSPQIQHPTSGPLDGNQKDAMLEEMVNRDLECKNAVPLQC